MRTAVRMLLLFLLAASAQPALAEGETLTFEFDGTNAPLASLLAQAKAEKKLVFLDFYLPG